MNAGTTRFAGAPPLVLAGCPRGAPAAVRPQIERPWRYAIDMAAGKPWFGCLCGPGVSIIRENIQGFNFGSNSGFF